MARVRNSIGIIIASVVGIVLVLGILVNMSLGARKWHSSFNDEMAQRLDLEEKVARMEKERSALMADTKDLTAQLERSKAESENLKSAIIREREEKQSLQARLEEMSQPVLTTAATAK